MEKPDYIGQEIIWGSQISSQATWNLLLLLLAFGLIYDH